MGRHGQKTSAGFYDYEEGSRVPQPSADVEAMIKGVAEKFGVEQREFTEEEIVQRCIYPLINEAARILEEGIALRPSDVDMVWINGYGFPPYRGGPMHFADSEGVKTLRGGRTTRRQDRVGRAAVYVPSTTAIALVRTTLSSAFTRMM
jgi:3-hydroxyacyl-CoA dehydrogenase